MEFGAQALLSFNMEKGRMKINFDFTVAEKQSRGGAAHLDFELWMPCASGCHWTWVALPRQGGFWDPSTHPTPSHPSPALQPLKGPLLKGLAF